MDRRDRRSQLRSTVETWSEMRDKKKWPISWDIFAPADAVKFDRQSNLLRGIVWYKDVRWAKEKNTGDSNATSCELCSENNSRNNKQLLLISDVERHTRAHSFPRFKRSELAVYISEPLPPCRPTACEPRRLKLLRWCLCSSYNEFSKFCRVR